MAGAASEVPGEGMLLCEGCGYILTGLPFDSRCPECARPISQSLPSLRNPPEWEVIPGAEAFWRTTAALLFRPTRFFRNLPPRGHARLDRRFARLHRTLSAVLLGVATFLQLIWLLEPWPDVLGDRSNGWTMLGLAAAGLLACCLGSYGFLAGLASLASRLTAWEAAYRGLRLPHAVVRRALDYHAAHYLPVALVALLTVGGYQGLVRLGVLSELVALRYLYVLCAEVVLGAAYLFHTYWIAMRKLMYANC